MKKIIHERGEKFAVKSLLLDRKKNQQGKRKTAEMQ